MPPAERQERQLGQADSQAIEAYFVGQGYQLASIDLRPRTIRLLANRAGRDYFIKLAATTKVSERIENEIAWNQIIAGRVAPTEPFSAPTVLEQGTFQDFRWYATAYIAGGPIAQPWQTSAEGLRAWLDRIVRTNYVIAGLTDLDLPRDRGQARPSAQEFADHLYTKTKTWIDALPADQQQELSSLLEDLRAIAYSYQPGVGHHDFVPWHMLAQGQRLLLIDGEHATALGDQSYDAVYFFHRVYTKASDPAVARLYFEKYLQMLSGQQRQQAAAAFLPLLASRIIGGFFDAQTDKTDLQPHRALLASYRAGELVGLTQ